MMYFDAYTSDLHVSHTNIIKYCGRPYNNKEHMNEMLIENYNSVVRKNDSVLFLGDIFFSSTYEEKKHFMSSLHGQKYLLRGNHDSKITDKQFMELGFRGVFSGSFLGEVGRHKVRFCHFPYYALEGDQRYKEQRPAKEDGIYLMHGHTHEKDKLTAYGTLHVGVDAWDYRPATYDEVVDCLNELDYNTRNKK